MAANIARRPEKVAILAEPEMQTNMSGFCTCCLTYNRYNNNSERRSRFHEQ